MNRRGKILKGRSATSATPPEEVSSLVRFRHSLYILGGAALLVFLVEPLFVPDPTPFLTRLTAESRSTLYEQIIPVSGSLLGFYIAAVAILAQLDHGREIVADLKRGESFSLLIINMLVTILLLFILTGLGVVGAVQAPGKVFIAISRMGPHQHAGRARSKRALLCGCYVQGCCLWRDRESQGPL